ncbi:hypothetical protein [Streptomyces sp. NBC_01435]|uniref:hypothetical protein n=1 Tax=Streptomyces sp. NBC_01435 TaxID=2903865 RepID=UPI002E38235F|nr:hypothetical protein [Streptomyces sp. NBC_01435]
MVRNLGDDYLQEAIARPVDGHPVGAENVWERSGRWTTHGQGVGKAVATLPTRWR